MPREDRLLKVQGIRERNGHPVRSFILILGDSIIAKLFMITYLRHFPSPALPPLGAPVAPKSPVGGWPSCVVSKAFLVFVLPPTSRYFVRIYSRRVHKPESNRGMQGPRRKVESKRQFKPDSPVSGVSHSPPPVCHSSDMLGL
jgi:hypothetical protein